MDNNMERAIDLGTAIGTIRGALWLYDSGMKELAISQLREMVAKLLTRADERLRKVTDTTR